VPIGIVTNGGSANQTNKINNSGLNDLVDAVIVSEEFGVKKPDPAIFHEVCSRLAIGPAASWFVGDNPEADIIGADAVGMHTIWLEGSMPWPQDSRKCFKHQTTSLSEAFNLIIESL